MKKRILALTLIATLAIALGGCGKAEASGKKIVAGLETGINPLSFYDENNNPAGFEVDLIRAIDEKLEDYTIDIELVEDVATEVGLDTGKYAFIGGGLYRTPAREEKYLFPSRPTSASVIKIFTNSANQSSISSLDDLVGKKIAPPSPNGGIYNLLTAYNEEHEQQLTFTTREGVEIADSFKEISDGTYDALVIPDNLGYKEIISKLNLDVVIAAEAVQVNPTYFVFGKQEEEFLSAFNTALDELTEDGTLTKLNEKWFGEDKLSYIK